MAKYRVFGYSETIKGRPSGGYTITANNPEDAVRKIKEKGEGKYMEHFGVCAESNFCKGYLLR